MRCKVCGDASPMFSGIDAFLFGVPTEVYCMQCVLADPELRDSIDQLPTSAELRSTTPPR